MGNLPVSTFPFVVVCFSWLHTLSQSEPEPFPMVEVTVSLSSCLLTRTWSLHVIRQMETAVGYSPRSSWEAKRQTPFHRFWPFWKDLSSCIFTSTPLTDNLKDEKIILLFLLVFLKRFTYLFERHGSLPKWLGLDQAKVRNQQFHSGLPCGWVT